MAKENQGTRTDFLEKSPKSPINTREAGGALRQKSDKAGLQKSAKAIDTREEIAKIAGLSHDTVATVCLTLLLLPRRGITELKIRLIAATRNTPK